jgi:hypothetical protein
MVQPIDVGELNAQHALMLSALAMVEAYKRHDYMMPAVADVSEQFPDVDSNYLIAIWIGVSAQNRSRPDDQRDAARYQWLRNRDLETVAEGGVFIGVTPENVVINGDDADAYIDARMRWR